LGEAAGELFGGELLELMGRLLDSLFDLFLCALKLVVNDPLVLVGGLLELLVARTQA
jgi:hypothetical protein